MIMMDTPVQQRNPKSYTAAGRDAFPAAATQDADINPSLEVSRQGNKPRLIIKHEQLAKKIKGSEMPIEDMLGDNIYIKQNSIKS
jgi:hypothetical protein